MTTFVLHGGETTKPHPENDRFFRCFTEFVEKEEVKILLCYFTKPEDDWETRMEAERKRIEAQTSKKVLLTIAKDPADLLEKMDAYDVLYVAGGNAEPIESMLPLLEGLKEKLEGKVYLGSSMGAFIVSSQYSLSFPTNTSIEVHYGLGLLPISTLCHWNIEKLREKKVAMLKEAAPQTPILTLDECKLTVLIM
jgi:peptidase E